MPKYQFNFLSRLCGGEGAICVVGSWITFLSRLCGGEAIHWRGAFSLSFLSRLCGGEVALTDSLK